MHLKPDELVDIAEGTRAESSAPHLAGCDACRQQLADLGAIMSEVAEVDVPEPSPMFWDHLSARVSEAIAAERAPRRFWRDLVSWPRVLMPISAVAGVALVVIVVGVTSRVGPTAPVGSSASPEALLDAQQIADDPSLGLIADLTGSLDLEAAREAALTLGGSAEHAVTHLSADELRELRRLLEQELEG